MGGEICERFRAQSLRFGTKIFSETVARVDLSSRPFHVYTGVSAWAPEWVGGWVGEGVDVGARVWVGEGTWDGGWVPGVLVVGQVGWRAGAGWLGEARGWLHRVAGGPAARGEASCIAAGMAAEPAGRTGAGPGACKPGAAAAATRLCSRQHAAPAPTPSLPALPPADEKEVIADAVIIATGAVARRLPFPGSDEEGGYWNKGISACAVCDGAAPMFRGQPIAVIGGGDSGGARGPACWLGCCWLGWAGCRLGWLAAAWAGCRGWAHLPVLLPTVRWPDAARC